VVRRIWVAPLVALALAGCGKSQTVNKPVAEVQTTLLSLPPDADAMPLANVLPGSSYWVEPLAGKIVWHFTHQGSEYGRYVAELSEDGASKTTVTTHFEDGPGDPAMSFLDKIATIAGDASISAAIQGHAVDRSGVQAAIQQQIAGNPVAAQVQTIETVADEMDKMAPPDRCKTGTPKEMNSWVCQKEYAMEANQSR
jgi:hypothetical protein